LSAFTAALALCSVMIGAGLVGIPYAYYYTGIIFGFFINILLSLLTCFSCYLYLRIKDLTGGLDSFSEIGYKLLGRYSIFWINTLIALLVIGGLVAYYNVFGSICSSLYV
jgi:amino acid permease